MRLSPVRRSEPTDEPPAPDDANRSNADPPVPPATAERDVPERPRQRRWGRNRASYSDQIDQAAERAAAATRTAAAAAAADRAHARPRTSGVAVLALVVAVLAAATVATSALAGPGIALGVLAVVFAFAGLASTGHRYRFLAGRGVATVALLLAIGAIAFGLLIVAGAVPGWDTDTNQVTWLHDQLPSWLT